MVDSRYSHRPIRRRQPREGISPLNLVLLLVAAVAVLALAWSCTHRGYVSPYHWERLTWVDVPGRADARPVYTDKSGTVTSKLGVDVSDQNGNINWNLVKNDGIEFAIVRAGWRGYSEGGANQDTAFVSNIRNASAAGLQVGCYFYSSAINADEAREEARMTLAAIAEAGVELDFPVVFDHEPAAHVDGRAANLDQKTATDIAKAYCETVEQAGHKTMVYGNVHDLARFDSSVTAKRPVWLASYEIEHPDVERDFSIWQYTGSGSVAGVETIVDMSIWFTQGFPL